ncbi:hypothetical protein D3C85_1553700 [compost metagenome]
MGIPQSGGLCRRQPDGPPRSFTIGLQGHRCCSSGADGAGDPRQVQAVVGIGCMKYKGVGHRTLNFDTGDQAFKEAASGNFVTALGQGQQR